MIHRLVTLSSLKTVMQRSNNNNNTLHDPEAARRVTLQEIRCAIEDIASTMSLFTTALATGMNTLHTRLDRLERQLQSRADGGQQTGRRDDDPWNEGRNTWLRSQ